MSSRRVLLSPGAFQLSWCWYDSALFIIEGCAVLSHLVSTGEWVSRHVCVLVSTGKKVLK